MKTNEFRKFWFFSTLALLQLSSPTTESENRNEELVCRQNTDQTCEEILRGEVNVLPNCREIRYGSIFSTYSIDDTQLLQPSVTLRVNSSQIDTYYQDNLQYTGYVIGYRGCTSNPTEQCSLFVPTLPSSEDNWIHIVNPEEGTQLLSPGKQCTFFGCFLYTEEDDYGACAKRILDTIFVENITILTTCPDPGDSVANGNVSFTFLQGRTLQYVEGTVANVTCDEGFVATYGGVSECQGDGTWNTTSLPTCERQCEELERSIDGGWIELSDITRIVGSTATVTCYDEYYTGGGSITCGVNGNWSSASTPQCIPVQCPEVHSIDGGEIEVQSPITKYKPSEGFVLVNTTITVTCYDYYSGGGSVTCRNGNWSPSLSSCSPVVCLEPEASVDNGKVELNTPDNRSSENGNYPVNTTMTLSCNLGHVGGGSITCKKDGNWTSPLPLCSRSYGPVIASIIIVTFTLLLIGATILAVCYKMYLNYRNDKIQRFFSMQARNESLDPNYAPIDLDWPSKVSIQSKDDEYYPVFSGSVTSLFPPIITTENQQLTKSHSLDDILNVSQSVNTSGPHVKENESVSEGTTAENSFNRSCPSLNNSSYVQNVSAKVTTKPSTSEDEHSDIVFDFTESSPSAVDSSGPSTNYSGIKFYFKDSLYPAFSEKTLTSYGPPPNESTDSMHNSETEIKDTLLDDPNLQDLAAIKEEAGSAPTNQPSYINLAGEEESLDETLSFSPLSPQIPTGVTLAFATVGGHFNHSNSDSASQRTENSCEPNSGYMNSSSGYTGECSFTCAVESDYTGELRSEFISESSRHSSGYVPESSDGGDPSSSPSEHQPCTLSSAYVSKSDLCNSTQSPALGQSA